MSIFGEKGGKFIKDHPAYTEENPGEAENLPSEKNKPNEEISGDYHEAAVQNESTLLSSEYIRAADEGDMKLMISVLEKIGENEELKKEVLNSASDLAKFRKEGGSIHDMSDGAQQAFRRNAAEHNATDDIMLENENEDMDNAKEAAGVTNAEDSFARQYEYAVTHGDLKLFKNLQEKKEVDDKKAMAA